MFVHLVFDGVADGPLGVALDIVAAAARVAEYRKGSAVGERTLVQRVVSVDGAPVTTGAGRRTHVDGALSLRGLGPGDAIVLAGLGAVTEDGIAALLTREDVVKGIACLRRASARGIGLAASCSATFVLAASGALDGRQATTTWWLDRLFARRFPRVILRSDRMVVASADVSTAGAAFAHADLLLAMLAARAGPSLAHTVAKYLVLDERPSQARYMIREHLRSSDPVIRKLERFVSANMTRRLALSELARVTATSPRSLARKVHEALGTTPQGFVRRLRMARAVHLLETTHASVDEVAARVGYADPSSFRRVFLRATGETPRDARR